MEKKLNEEDNQNDMRKAIRNLVREKKNLQKSVEEKEVKNLELTLKMQTAQQITVEQQKRIEELEDQVQVCSSLKKCLIILIKTLQE